MARSHDAKVETSGQMQSVEQFIFTHIQKHPANGQTPRTTKTLQKTKTHKHVKKQMKERNNHRKDAEARKHAD